MTVTPELRARSRQAAERIVDGCGLAVLAIVLMLGVTYCVPRAEPAPEVLGSVAMRMAFDTPAYTYLYQTRRVLAVKLYPDNPAQQAAFVRWLDSTALIEYHRADGKPF